MLLPTHAIGRNALALTNCGFASHRCGYMSSKLLLLAFALVLTACVPVPFVLPPAKLDAGVAVRGGGEGVRATFPLRAGLHIQQLLDEQGQRRFEVAPGWAFFPTINGEFLHGPYLEAGMLWPSVAEENALRWGTNLKLHYLFGAEDGYGDGVAATAQGTVEWVSYTVGEFLECDSQEGCSVGASIGEVSVGFFAEATMARLSNEYAFWAGGGLIFRIPVAVGVALIPIWEFGD